MTSNKWKRAVAATALLAPELARAAYELNLQPPITPIARQIYDLHTLIMWVILGIFVVVFGAMFYAIWKHRKSVGHKAAHFHENTTVEVIWTIIPFFILAGMAYPATKTVLDMKDASNPDMTVKVTGYQWKWEYDYLQDGVHFFSSLATPREQIQGAAPKGEHYLLEVDNPMVVPIGKKVRVLLTANDVLHAWWVPALGAKQDAIPGYIRDIWFSVDKPGTYRGQCVELCGKDHAYMPIVVQAVSEADYKTWVAQKQAETQATQEDPSKEYTQPDLVARGEKVYGTHCASCHQANGQGIPGAFPGLDGSKVATGPIDAHVDIVLNGKAGTAMPAFGGQLSPVEIASVVTYERNAWNNRTGDAIQPRDIAARQKQ